MVKKLLAKGADFNIQNKQGYTAMHIAALVQNKAIFDELLSYGADTDAKNYHGDTPMTLAPKSWVSEQYER